MAEYRKILPVTDVKRRFLEILKNVQEIGGATMITKNGRPAGVLLGVEEYEGILETLEIMADPETVKALRESIKQAERGEVYTHEEVWADEEI
jgi:antitoxin YefM